MGNSTHELALLNYGAAGHPLNYTAGLRDERRVGYGDEHSFKTVIFVNALYLDLIFIDRVALKRAVNARLTGLYIAGIKRLAVKLRRTLDAAAAVDLNIAQKRSLIRASVKSTR